MRKPTQAELDQIRSSRCERCEHMAVDHFDMNGHCQHVIGRRSCRCENFVANEDDLPLLRRVWWGE